MNAPPVLAARGVSKAFAGVAALTAVDFDVRAGEVVALVGENGAGKSTLLRALSGELRPDVGEVRLDGRAVHFAGPAEAYAAGIARVAQEPQQCASLSVAAAVFLGAELRRGWVLHDRAMEQRAAELLRELGLQLDPRAAIGTLATGQRQLVEIARALRAQARVLILDEPTSSLTHAESERLFGIVAQLRLRGTAIVYVTHRMAEITRLADRVVVLRDGRNSGAMTAAEASHERIVAAMVGRELQATQRAPVPPGEVVLDVRGVATAAFPAVSVDLQLREGEVVGIAGLLGAGRSELLRALVGVDRRLRGEVRVAGAPLRGLGPAEAAAAGLVLVPEDRQHEGLSLTQSVLENVSLPTLRRRGALVDAARERAHAAHWQQALGVRAASLDLPVAALSGGNQQKVAIARWLAAAPKVLLLDEPTRGVDVGARAEIYARLDALARSGLAVLFVSSDLEEVLALADRVLVLHQGAVAGELSGDAETEDSIMMLATGGRVAEGA